MIQKNFLTNIKKKILNFLLIFYKIKNINKKF